MKIILDREGRAGTPSLKVVDGCCEYLSIDIVGDVYVNGCYNASLGVDAGGAISRLLQTPKEELKIEDE